MPQLWQEGPYCKVLSKPKAFTRLTAITVEGRVKKLAPSVVSAALALGLIDQKDSTQSQQPKRAMTIEVDLVLPTGSHTVRALLDSGAEGNFMSQLLVTELGMHPTTSNTRAHTVGGQPIQVYRHYTVSVAAADSQGTRKEHA